MPLSDYQKQIDDWAQTHQTPYWSALSGYARLVEEVGELGRLLNHIYGDKPKKSDEAKQELGEEIADVLFTLICQANREGINLDEALNMVITKAKTRDKDRFEKRTA